MSQTVTATGQLQRVPCPGCRADTPSLFATEDGLGINRCETCGLIYVSPRLDEPQRHYHGEREAILRKYEPVLSGRMGHNRDRNYDQELRALARWRPSGRLLDVGTHCGFFLRRARGKSWELFGVEPSTAAAALAREYFGLDVRPYSLTEAAFPDRFFDVVTLVDVFEHVDEPGGLLAEIRRILREDGVLFLKVPNVRYSLFKYRLFRRALGLQMEIFDAKEHVAHYGRDTLAFVLERGGFRLLEAFVPYPIQDGAWWKCAARDASYRLAKLHHRLTGGAFGPLATDIAVIATPSMATPPQSPPQAGGRGLAFPPARGGDTGGVVPRHGAVR